MSLHDLIGPQPLQPIELSRALGPDGVKRLLELIRDAYFDLVQSRKINRSMDENQITEELCIHIQKCQRLSGILPSVYVIHEKQDRTQAKNTGKAPTVDFCFRGEWRDDVYFGAKCKIVEADNKKLCEEFVSNGVMRYVAGKYGQAFQEGAMLGYIRSTECEAVAAELRTRMEQLDGSPSLHRSDLLLPFQDYHTSCHQRVVGITPLFTIHHLLFLFAT
ncbi:MAG: hypothetical protein IPM84_06310 [Anaerolineae bacterium]|nr:hypothetical protein [Anaerolineae bacterium]